MTIAAVIVTYNNSQKELEMLKKSLVANGLKEKDIYFSDNTKENLGYGGGINRILRKILNRVFPDLIGVQDDNSYDAFFILNPDIVLHKNCIKELLRTFEKNLSIGIVGPKILDGKGKIWSMGGELDKKRYSGGLIDYEKANTSSLLVNGNTKVDFISGTAMLIKKEVFEKIGLFAEDYFLYYEDVDFCLRAKKAGFQLAINPESVITHYPSSSVGKNSPMQQYYMARNHLLVVKRYGKFFIKLHELLRLPKTFYEAKNKKYELLGIRDYFLRRFGKSDYWG